MGLFCSCTIYLELSAWTHSPYRQVIDLQTPTKIASISVCFFRPVTLSQGLKFVLRFLALYKYVCVYCMYVSQLPMLPQTGLQVATAVSVRGHGRLSTILQRILWVITSISAITHQCASSSVEDSLCTFFGTLISSYILHVCLHLHLSHVLVLVTE